MRSVAAQLESLGAEIAGLERRILLWHREDETSRRLATIPGVGPITASAMAASAPDPTFSDRDGSLRPGSGSRPARAAAAARNGRSARAKMGDGYLRRRLVVGATAVLRHVRQRREASAWLLGLLERKTAKSAAVALANKTARIAWALIARKEVYAPPVAA